MKRVILAVVVAGMVGCAAPARPLKPVPTGPAAPLTQKQIDICLNHAKTSLQWKDRESVRVEEAYWNGPGGPNGGQVMIAINAKNSYGAYIGSRRFLCGLFGDSVEWYLYPW